jgi:hypothetical protein
MSTKISTAGKHVSESAKRAPERVRKKAAAKSPSVAKKIAAPKVTFRVASGGFHVYGTTVRPKHFSTEQIAAAVASLD